MDKDTQVEPHWVLYIEKHGLRQRVCSCGWRGAIFNPQTPNEFEISSMQDKMHRDFDGDWNNMLLPPLLSAEPPPEESFPDTPMSERGFGTL